jgi:hypothetical protein
MKYKVWHCYDLNGVEGTKEDQDWEYSFITPLRPDSEVVEALFRELGVSKVFLNLFLGNQKELCSPGTYDCSAENESVYITTEEFDFHG